MTSLLSIVFILSGGIEILVPLGLGFYFTRKLGTGWRTWFAGALMFLISLIRLPVNNLAYNWIAGQDFSNYTFILVYLVGSITAGVFEETARYIGLRYLVKQNRYQDSLTYGAGHGGIESILLVGVNVITLGFILLVNPGQLPPNQLASLNAMPWYLPLVGAYERVMTILIHISLSVMVLEAIKKENIRYLLLAILIHTAIDYLSTSASSYSIFYGEMVVTGFALGLSQWAYSKTRHLFRDDRASPQT